jgi:23S rRNA (adenine2503-C2)-methyltransferase
MSTEARPAAPVDLAGLDLEELTRFVLALGEPAFRARQLYAWIHRRGVTAFAAMTDLGRALRARLATRATIGALPVARETRSVDGTRKFLLRLADDRGIESVLIPEAGRVTACLSTQAGCVLRCRFCLTAQVPNARNLTAGEIVGQVLALRRALEPEARLTHLVLMGMGEPLANFPQTAKALGMLMAPEGLAFSPRRITLSTAGLVPGIRRLAESGLGVNLAVSLNATTDALRTRLMPHNAQFPLAALLEACRRFPLDARRRLTFEYVLLAGINDAPEDARRVPGLLHGIRCKVNLIPFNEAPGLAFRRPSPARVAAFREVLGRGGVLTTVRESKGRDILAACGLLAGREADEGGPALRPRVAAVARASA